MIVLWLLMPGFNQSSFSFLFKYYYSLYFIQFQKNNFQTLFFILFLIGSAVVSHSRILQNKWSFLFWYAFRDLGWQQRYARFCGRVVVLSILSLLLYPFLWAWTIIGTLWFTSARDCVSISFPIFLGYIHLPTLLIHETMMFDSCSCLKRVRNGVSLFGCFSATVDCFALPACLWERSVTLSALCVWLSLHSAVTYFWALSETSLIVFRYFWSHFLCLPHVTP